MELICKCQPLNGDNGEILLAVLGAFGGLPAEDHLRVVNKIAVDGKAILVLAEVYPIRFDLNGTVTLWRKRMSETTSVPALARNALLGRRMAPSSSARCAMYLRTSGDCLSIV